MLLPPLCTTLDPLHATLRDYILAGPLPTSFSITSLFPPPNFFFFLSLIAAGCFDGSSDRREDFIFLRAFPSSLAIAPQCVTFLANRNLDRLGPRAPRLSHASQSFFWAPGTGPAGFPPNYPASDISQSLFVFYPGSHPPSFF